MFVSQLLIPSVPSPRTIAHGRASSQIAGQHRGAENLRVDHPHHDRIASRAQASPSRVLAIIQVAEGGSVFFKFPVATRQSPVVIYSCLGK
jgi:hypothetical protein